jgi:hypothetical protein
MKKWAQLSEWWVKRRSSSRQFQQDLDTFLALSLLKLRNRHGAALLEQDFDVDTHADVVTAEINKAPKV